MIEMDEIRPRQDGDEEDAAQDEGAVAAGESRDR